MENLLEGLNEAQRQAVSWVDGPLMVLAGPGSGKTRVVTRRVAHLVRDVGVPAENVLAVTFTNKAAEEMRHRVAQLVGAAQPTVCTFHRFCARLLRRYGGPVGVSPTYSILDQDDRVKVTTAVMRELKLDDMSLSPKRVDSRISQLKNDLILPADYAATARDYVDQMIAAIYPKYQERLRAQNAVDFDDLLLLTVELLQTQPAIRAALDARYRYVTVDEYQDTNLAQYRIARMLKTDLTNLCVTGDPDQSIYSWRGANPKNVFQFEEDYPGSTTIRLEQNYRSTGLILAAADGLIRFNRGRKHKRLVSTRGPGEPVAVFCHANDEEEARFVAETIRRAVDQGERKYRDFAVFVRMTGLWGRFETAFRVRHIPYQVVGGSSFFQRTEIRDVLAYARLACNSRDDAAFERIVNVPPRGLGDTSLDRLRQAAAKAGVSLLEASSDQDLVARAGIRGKQRGSLADFARMMEDLADAAKQAPAVALEAILDRTDYRSLLDPLEEDERQERLNNLEGMVRDARAFTEQEPDAGLPDFLETIGLLGAVDERDDRSDQVTVMTLHAAKGLEFPVVFLVAFEQDILPHERAVHEGSLEEERRLAFVGITRAREQLYLSYVRRRMLYARNLLPTPSQFLAELPDESLHREDRIMPTPTEHHGFDDDGFQPGYEEPAIQIVRKSSEPSPSDRFRIGMLVDHPRYGTGRILQVEGVGEERKATITFPSVGVKRFVVAKAPLAPK